MKTIVRHLFMTLILLAQAGTCFAGLADFAGSWVNIDPNTQGITALEVQISGAAAKIQAFGRCQPKDCNWGSVPASVHGPSPTADLQTQAKALTAIFQTKLTMTLVVITQPDANSLQVEMFTRYIDKSGRSNVADSFELRRKGDIVPVSPTVVTTPAAPALTSVPGPTPVPAFAPATKAEPQPQAAPAAPASPTPPTPPVVPAPTVPAPEPVPAPQPTPVQ